MLGCRETPRLVQASNIPALLEMVAHQVTVDAERPWVNPFHDFLEAAEDVRHHYRELSNTDFENTLARKWVVDSLMAAARVHWALLMQPPAGTEDHIDDVDQSLRWLVSWVGIAAWKAWAEKHQSAIVGMVGTLGKT